MAFRSSAIASAATGAITATPAGVQVGDYLGGLFTLDASVGNVSFPAGWAQQDSWVHTVDGQSTWYADKIAAGGDSFQFNDGGLGSGGARSLVTAAWSGRDTASPRSATPVKTFSNVSNASPISATYTGITASQSDDIAIFFFTDQGSAAERWLSTAITNYTERQDGVNQDWVSGIGLQTRDNVNAGATGNFSATLSNSVAANAGYGALVVAIRIAGGNAADRGLPGNRIYYTKTFGAEGLRE